MNQRDYGLGLVAGSEMKFQTGRSLTSSGFVTGSEARGNALRESPLNYKFT